MFTILSRARIISRSLKLSPRICFMSEETAAKRPKIMKIGTHDGVFHCDEVLACFMLQQLPEYKDATIVRSRDQKKLDECDIVVDVGSVFDPDKRRFDHHQRTFNETLGSLKKGFEEFKIKLSSAGLVYCFFGEKVIKEILKKNELDTSQECVRQIYRKVYENLIQEVDAIDNGVPICEGDPKYIIHTHLSGRVGNFNPNWNETEKTEPDKLFEQAKAYVGAEMVDKVVYFARSWWPAREIVQQALESRLKVHKSGEILELTTFCPWKKHLPDLETQLGVEGLVKYVIFLGDGKEDDWRVICVPVTPDSFICRKFLHKDWRGIRDEELAGISGIPDIRFVHNTGFIGGAKTREGVLKMAELSLAGEYTD